MASMLMMRSRSLLPSLSPGVCNTASRAFATVEDVSDTEEHVSRPPSPVFQGVFKAVLLGQLLQPPSESILKSGKSIYNLLVATGGMRVTRKAGATQNEPVKQVHKVVVYNDRFKDVIKQKVKKGSPIYLEGNMESRVFNDPVTGVVKSVREIAVRHNGRLFLVEDMELRGVNNRGKNRNSDELGEEHDAEEIITRS